MLHRSEAAMQCCSGVQTASQLTWQVHAGGQRVATVLMYLTTPEEGGETVFPNADRNVTGPEWSECAKKGLGLKAVKGDALMFFSLHPDGTEVCISALLLRES